MPSWIARGSHERKAHRMAGKAVGMVETYNEEEGWGVVASPALPDGARAWVHFSAIEAEGYRSLRPGQRVEFRYLKADQDGYRYRVEWLRTFDESKEH